MSLLGPLLTAIVCWGVVYLIVRHKKPSLSGYLNATLHLPSPKATKAAALIGALIVSVPLWLFFVAWPFLVAFGLILWGGHLSPSLGGGIFRVLWIAAPVLALVLARRYRLPAPYLVSIVVAALLSLLITIGPIG
jgi:hypothetical protein